MNLIETKNSNLSAYALCSQINMLDALNWVQKALSQVKIETISNCFRSSGYVQDQVVSSLNELELDEDYNLLAQLVGSLNVPEITV